jgi:hypothetical protein
MLFALVAAVNAVACITAVARLLERPENSFAEIQKHIEIVVVTRRILEGKAAYEARCSCYRNPRPAGCLVGVCDPPDERETAEVLRKVREQQEMRERLERAKQEERQKDVCCGEVPLTREQLDALYRQGHR